MPEQHHFRQFAVLAVILLLPAFALWSAASGLLARPAIGLFYGLGNAGVTDAMARDFGRHAADFALAALRAGPASAAGPGRRASRQSGAIS